MVASKLGVAMELKKKGPGPFFVAYNNYKPWLVVTGTMEFCMTFHSVGNGKSSQLTNSISFQRGRYTTNQS
jgi:hypothetical protein